MRVRGLGVVLFALLAAGLVNGSQGAEVKFDLPGVAIGGGAASPDGSTLVVALTAKAELVYYDAEAGKEAKRVTVEFQPTKLAWDGKLLYAAQKGSAVVHILDAASGKELKTAKAGGPVRNLAIAKGVCFASDDNRGVYAITEKGDSTKTAASGTFVAADPKGTFVCTVIDGRARTDIIKHSVDGTKLTQTATLPGAVGSSLVNVQGVCISGDGKLVGVVAGGGWTATDRKRHYAVPLYDTEDMKTMVGELETGAFPRGCIAHPVLPLFFACNDTKGSVFSAKSQAAGQTIEVGRAAGPTVLAFVAKGKKVAYGWTVDGPSPTSQLKICDLELTKEQLAELDKGK
jgi:hypothetical protein